ncbi:Y-family DNA polymerase [Caldalkalibacillus salinus]|uniref:Y-family DNA polymerase n=1 Tax=Caldalkalibacillus salinus TaxID=2803787 RepID=UPI001924AC37|nr:DNA polymerase IV [Caldalkalibacillus salinus]
MSDVQLQKHHDQHGQPSRYIMLADMNSFFASCHQSVDPALRHKPVIVGGSTTSKRRGMVIAASYEAKAKGVYTTMSSYEAKRKCPEAIFVMRDHTLYQNYSTKIMNFLRLIGDTEVASIDEAYVDITPLVQKGKKPQDIATYIQSTLWKKLHMPCSIGVGSNRIIAKMAAEIKKPRGYVQLGVKQFCTYFYPQPLSQLHGCGQKTAEKFEKNNIFTIGDLAEADPLQVKLILGKRGEHLQHAAQGKGSAVIYPDREKGDKTIGKETTFQNHTTDQGLIKSLASRMVEQLASKLEQKRKKVRTVSVVYKLERGKGSHSKSVTLAEGTKDQSVLYDHVQSLYQQHLAETPIILFGVRFSNLEDLDYEQLTLEDFM